MPALELDDPFYFSSVPGTSCEASFEYLQTTGEVTLLNIEGYLPYKFYNEEDKYSFGIDGFEGIDSPTSHDELLSATLGEGEEGHKVALTLEYCGGNIRMNTHYIYEWKKIPPEIDTQIENKDKKSKEVQESNKDDKEVRKSNNELNFWIWWEEEASKYTDEQLKAMTDMKVQFGNLHGEVLVLRGCDGDMGQAFFASFDTPLQHGDMIITSRRSRAILSFGDMSTYEIGPDSKIILDLLSREQTKLQLVMGRVWANIKKIPAGGSLEI